MACARARAVFRWRGARAARARIARMAPAAHQTRLNNLSLFFFLLHIFMRGDIYYRSGR